MTFVKTSLLSAIAVGVRIVTSLALNKILAVYVGPGGYAIIGQFQNMLSFVLSLAGGMIATGVTKATAQHIDDKDSQHTIWQTAVRFSILASVAAGLIMLLLSQWLAQWLLHTEDMADVLVWLAVMLPAAVLNNLLLAIVNGKKEIGIYVTVNIVGSLLGLILTGLLTSTFGVRGALIAFTLNPAATLLVTGALVTRCRWFAVPYIWGAIKPNVMRELTGFGLMAITSAIAIPVSHILIRDHLVTHIGFAAAGYWQGMWKISEIYLMLITSPLSLYYLPRLAEITSAHDLMSEILKMYRFVLPFALLGAVSIFFLRDFIIQTLFTQDFGPMRELFPWQLIGDVIKVSSLILAYVMLGRVMVRFYVITEMASSISFYLLTCIFVSSSGLPGVTIAYALNYGLYGICMIYMVRREMHRMVGTNG